jgi:DNA-directed RNA polymerase subunit RPC12/RpoP
MAAFLTVRCPACKATLRIAHNNADRPLRCPPCGQRFLLRAPRSLHIGKTLLLLLTFFVVIILATANWTRLQALVVPTVEAAPPTTAASPVPAALASGPSFEKDVQPLVQKYCIRCHSASKKKGGVVLDGFRTQTDVLGKRGVWEKAGDNLRSGEMPPSGAARPTAAEMAVLEKWFDHVVFSANCAGPQDPGRVTLRRLNRAEYYNTIHDLVGVEYYPANDFPGDDVGYGFDNIGDVLSLPPLLMEKYLRAAEEIVAKLYKDIALRTKILGKPVTSRTEARAVIEKFTTLAYRRPVTPDEVRRLMKFVESARENGVSHDDGLRTAITAILVSPHFLFRVELDRGTAKEATLLNEWELASRLSYFLWSSMPDEELFRLAREKKLREPGVLEGQVRRLLKDPKSKALADNFASQWLTTRSLDSFTPDPKLFPEFNGGLRRLMLRETELFFLHIARENRSILEFIDADYTFANEDLGDFYGLKDVPPKKTKFDLTFHKVSTAGTPRGGVLTQAAVLAVTSNPTRTSPVKRGKFILDNILGTPPPPPPPEVPELADEKKGPLKGTVRQRLEQHRENPSCAVCHQRMDPLGFGFENFDVIGNWRTEDNKERIDASGILPDGSKFNGPAELKKILLKKKDLFARCLTEKLLTYAIGRGLERADRCVVDELVTNLVKQDYQFHALVVEIVKSDPFQKRSGKGGRSK